MSTQIDKVFEENKRLKRDLEAIKDMMILVFGDAKYLPPPNSAGRIPLCAIHMSDVLKKRNTGERIVLDTSNNDSSFKTRNGTFKAAQ